MFAVLCISSVKIMSPYYNVFIRGQRTLSDAIDVSLARKMEKYFKLSSTVMYWIKIHVYRKTTCGKYLYFILRNTYCTCNSMDKTTQLLCKYEKWWIHVHVPFIFSARLGAMTGFPNLDLWSESSKEVASITAFLAATLVSELTSSIK